MDAIAAIYDALDDEDIFADLSRRLAMVAGARSAILQTLTKDGQIREGRFNHFAPEIFERYVELEIYRLDPWRAIVLRPKNLNQLVLMNETVPLQTVLSSTFYEENFRRWGDDTVDCFGGCFETSDGLFTIGIHRGLGAKPFSDASIAAFQSLVPHFRRLVELRARLGAVETKVALTEAALNEQPDAIFIVDANGRPVLMNKQAQALVGRADGLMLSRGGLSTRTDTSRRRLADAIATACARKDSQGAALSIPQPVGPPLRVLVSPVRVGDLTRALVVVNDVARPDGPRAAVLRGLYNLSVAESETAVALAKGLHPAEIARLRGVTMATVRTQISKALAKTEARGIPELVALVASVPCGA